MGRIFYIMGKSASGKDHVYETLMQEKQLSLAPLVLYTTRPIRSGETEGKEYFFVDEEKLELLRKAGKIIEERAYHTVYGIWSILLQMMVRLIWMKRIIWELGRWNLTGNCRDITEDRLYARFMLK